MSTLHFRSLVMFLLSAVIIIPAGARAAEIVNALNHQRPDIVDLVKAEVESGKERLAEQATETVRSLFGRVSGFVYEKIGVNLAEGVKLLGQFFVWLFEALAALTRWLLNIFSTNG